MAELISAALRGDASALQGLAAFITVLAIVPAAVLFIVNQLHQNSLLRNERHRYITEQYHIFLDKCLAFPGLRLGPYDAVALDQLSDDELYQRDTLFDLLTSLFETAYLAYANRISSHRKRQWGGWDDYVDVYVGRADYREWWLRIAFGGDISYLSMSDAELRTLNVSQYDLRFEQYMIAKLRAYPWELQVAAKPTNAVGQPGTDEVPLSQQ